MEITQMLLKSELQIYLIVMFLCNFTSAPLCKNSNPPAMFEKMLMIYKNKVKSNSNKEGQKIEF